MTDAQRQYVLRQQLKAIQTELGEGDGEAAELRKRVAEAGLPERVAAVANREVDRLERMTPASPEYQMIRTYLDWVLDVPWDKPTEDRLDPIEARRVLDEDHYDLDKVKERIVEYLAVQKLEADRLRRNRTADGPACGTGAPGRIGPRGEEGPILCFVGPPGVGKTSLGQSIAPIDEPQVRAHLARRRARRGGDPRPPPHLHRLDARAASCRRSSRPARPTRC